MTTTLENSQNVRCTEAHGALFVIASLLIISTALTLEAAYCSNNILMCNWQTELKLSIKCSASDNFSDADFRFKSMYSKSEITAVNLFLH